MMTFKQMGGVRSRTQLLQKKTENTAIYAQEKRQGLLTIMSVIVVYGKYEEFNLVSTLAQALV